MKRKEKQQKTENEKINVNQKGGVEENPGFYKKRKQNEVRDHLLRLSLLQQKLQKFV